MHRLVHPALARQLVAEPQVVVEGAVFHRGGPLQPLPQLPDVARAVMPAVFGAAEDVFAILGIKIKRIKATGVEEACIGRGYFLQQVRFGIGYKKPETLLEMVDLGPGPVR